MVTIKTDHRARFRAARDQGPRPTCLAFAVSDAHAAERPPHESLSADYLYFHALKHMPANYVDKGVGLAAATAAMQGEGQPLETAWPYAPVLPAEISNWSPPQGLTVNRGKITPHSATVDDICGALDRGQPSVIILRLSERFFYADSSGFLPARTPDVAHGLHAVVAVAHGTKAAIRHILIRNSWGNGWGKDGHAWLTEDYLSPRLSSVTSIKAV